MLRRWRLLLGVVGTLLWVSLRRLVRGAKHRAWSWRKELVAEAARFVVGRAGLAMPPGRKGRGASTEERTLPGDIRWTRTEIAGLRAEVHTPAGWTESQPTLLYMHGGGYVTCSPATHRDLISRIAKASGARCIAPNYRKAPKCPFPGAIEDALGCYRALLEGGTPPHHIFIGGDSAGGGLALATLLRLRDAVEPLPRAGILISPWVDLEASGATIDRHAPYDYLSRTMLMEASNHYLCGHDRRDPLVSAIHADLRGMPPLLVQTGGAELFFDENALLVERARQAGVAVAHEIGEGMVHVYQVFAPILPEARDAIAAIGAFVRRSQAMELQGQEQAAPAS